MMNAETYDKINAEVTKRAKRSGKGLEELAKQVCKDMGIPHRDYMKYAETPPEGSSPPKYAQEPEALLRDPNDLQAAVDAYKSGKDFHKFLRDDNDGGAFSLAVDRMRCKKQASESRRKSGRLPLLEDFKG